MYSSYQHAALERALLQDSFLSTHSDTHYDKLFAIRKEVAFQHGTHYQVKFVGNMEILRPSSRVEIVAAMRRVRYECKARGLKKQEVILTTSVDGIKVTIRNKKKRKFTWSEKEDLLLYHELYRIFYVCHDSQELRIFSYITKDPDNTYQVFVFKAGKKLRPSIPIC